MVSYVSETAYWKAQLSYADSARQHFKQEREKYEKNRPRDLGEAPLVISGYKSLERDLAAKSRVIRKKLDTLESATPAAIGDTTPKGDSLNR